MYSLLVRTICLGVGVLLFGCAGDNGEEAPSTAKSFNFAAMMANYADNIILPGYAAFAQQVSDAQLEIDSYCKAIGGAEQAAKFEKARQAWQTLQSQWQGLELFQLGPITENQNNLRNRIYSYNSNVAINTCAVDQAVILAQGAEFALSARSYNSRGLDALEYLLFNDNLEHTCPSQITETSQWNDLAEDERRSARCQYSQALLRDIGEATSVLQSSWLPEGKNYRTQFINPANTAQQLEALTNAIFYIEEDVKDRKLGLALGISAQCSKAACPEVVESPFSASSIENIHANLVALKTALTGGEGLGFDDIIVAEGFAQINSELLSAVDRAIALAQTIADSPSLLQQSEDILSSDLSTLCEMSVANPELDNAIPGCALYGRIKAVTDILRIDFVAVVNVDLPERTQSDND